MSGRSATDVRSLGILFNLGTGSALYDAELLEQFLSHTDEAADLAFESLVLRHGPMVFDVCLKILGNSHDAQDAFQATFLILATKARSIVQQKSLGSWLHGVALRVARRARCDAARRKVQERKMAQMRSQQFEAEPLPELHHFQVLHEEVERLPKKYREAIVLCYLEGMTLEMAARHLGCPASTVGVRVMRARERLRARLSRRGVPPPECCLIAGASSSFASTILPDLLVSSAVPAATRVTSGGMLSRAAAKLTTDVLRTMFMIKLAKISAAFLVAMIAVGTFGGFLAHSGILSAKEPGNEQPKQVAAFRVGQQVVTKYQTPVGDWVEPDRRLRVYTVGKIEGARVRLVSESIDGWVESTEIVLLDQAIDFYTKEIQDDPANAPAYVLRGMVWYHKGENRKAIADYTEAIRSEPDNEWPHRLRASVFCDEAEFDKAIADYNEIIQVDPKDADAYYNRGRTWSLKNEYDQAIADYDRAIELDPEDAWNFYSRGLAWSWKGDQDKAIEDFTEAIRLDPKYARTYLGRSQAWTFKNEYDKVIADCTEALQLDPKADEAVLHNTRGMAWAHKKEADKAIADFTEAIRLNPKDDHAYVWRGWSWAGKKEYEKAVADYNESIRLDPKKPGGYLFRGKMWRDRQDHDKAIADSTEAIRLDPKYADAYAHRAWSWCCKNEFDKAIADYTDAIRLKPQVAENYLRRGYAWDHKGEGERAIADFTDAIRLNPKYDEAYLWRGIAFESKGQHEKALADWNETARLNPQSAWAYRKRAWIWATCSDAKNRDGKMAVESATRGCELTEWKDSAQLEVLAAACAEANDFESAVKWQIKAIELTSDDKAKAGRDSRLARYREKKPYHDR